MNSNESKQTSEHRQGSARAQRERLAQIDRVCNKLNRLWRAYPEERLGQIIENLVIPSGDKRGPATAWLFYAHDKDAEAHLDSELKKERATAKSPLAPSRHAVHSQNAGPNRSSQPQKLNTRPNKNKGGETA